MKSFSFKKACLLVNILILSSNLTLIFSQSFGKDQINNNSKFISVENIHFKLADKNYFYAGTNTYYLMVYAADKNLRKDVDEVLEKTAKMGLKVIRTWAFNDGKNQWNALQTSPGVYQEYVFQGLDYILHKADSLGFRVILPLVNNWDDYGGMNQYVKWSSTASSHNNFYTDLFTKQWYKNHVSTIINRVNSFNGKIYKDDPTIFAWELANESRAEGDQTGNILNDWIVEMSAYIKSIDNNHLVTTGVEGFYNKDGSSDWMQNGRTGTDFIRNHQIETIDFATVHVWPDHWGLDYNQSMNWIQEHIDDAHNVIGKPVIIEEFGKERDEGGITVTRDKFFQGYYNTIYDKRAGGSNFWILYHDSYPDYDGFGVYFHADSSTVQIITTEAEKMNALTETSVKEPPQKKTKNLKLKLENYPNPFNSSTVICYQVLEDKSHVVFRIYNLLGEKVRILVNEEKANGNYEVIWDGRNDMGKKVASGVYLSIFKQGKYAISKKMIVLQ